MQVRANRQLPRDDIRPTLAKFPNSLSNELDLLSALKRIHEFKSLPIDWNGLGSEPPTYSASAQAAMVLFALASESLRPERVAPSADGGVGITLRRSGKFASIESLNSGEIVVLTSDGTGNPRAWEIDASDAGFRATAQTLREYFER